MERNREGRRGSMPALATTMNGGGPSRRRQKRSSSRRVSPEDDDGGGGRMEMYRSSSRSKKRRRTGRDDSSEESFGEDEEDDDDYVRFPTTTSSSVTNQPPPASSSSSSMHQHAGRSSSSKPTGPPAPLSWSVVEEIIGVPVPRRARSSSLKRSQESIGGGGELLMHRRQSSPSPSPSSSNASVRKQKKPISGPKHRRQPKISKSSSSSTQEIEIEVAEVLFGMTRQSPLSSSSWQESKSGASSPARSFSPPQPATSQSRPSNSATAPKRKRPRPQFEKESLATRSKIELLPRKADEGLASASPSRQEMKIAAVSRAVGYDSIAGSHLQESATQENGNSVPERKEDEDETTASKSKEASCSNLDEATANKAPREENFSIDLMVPPPPPPWGNSEREGLSEYLEPVKKLDIMNGEIEKPDKSLNQEATTTTECSSAREERNAGKCMADDIHSKNKCTTEEKQILELEQDLDLEKKDKDSLSLCVSSKGQQQAKQQPEEPRPDPKPSGKNGPSIVSAHPASLQLTMPIAGWPGNFPHFGYMGQVPSLPAVMPIDGSSVTYKTSQPPHFFPPQKRKRCATHCYIAQNIHYNQQIAQMNPFWPPAAAGTLPIYGANPCNPNVMLQAENPILSKLLQGSFPGRSLGQLQDKASPAVATYAGASAKEKSATAASTNSTLMEAYRKQFLLQQTPHPVSAAAAPPPPPNMLHGPAFTFPSAQQPAAATPSVAPKSNEGICNARPSAASVSSIAAVSGPSVHPVTTMSFNYPTLPTNDAQYLAFLQNYGYPFPTPTHVGGGPLPPARAMPFFPGSFYSSPMLHPSQQQPQQQQPSNQPQHPAPSQQGHHNPSTPSGSSSSQEHHSQQSQRAPGGAGAAAAPAGGNSHTFPASKQHLHLPPPQARQPESEAACEDSPSPADSTRTSQAQKSMYGKFAVIAPTAAALPSNGAGGSGCHKEKQQPQQNQANLTPSHAYAMSFAAAAAASGGAPGIDFSSMVQNHAFFQSLPEAARHHGYQQIAAATAAQAAEHKKSHHRDGKSGGDPGTVNAKVSCEEGKMMISTSKAPGSSAQHSLSFSRPENDHTISTLPVNSSCITEGSSRNANLMQLLAIGGRTSNRSSIAAPASSSAAVTAVTPANPTLGSLNMQLPQQQQAQRHLIQLQLQQQTQQQLQLQKQMSSRPTKKTSSHSTNNTIVYSDRMPSGLTMTRFPQGTGFPPSVIQGASAGQSPQWKASGRAVEPGPPANSATSTSSSAKNQLPQQQQQQQQALLSSNAHQTQISFGLNLSKTVGVSGQTHLAGGSSNSSLTSAAAMAAGSCQNSVLKSGAGNGGSAGGNGSPRASTSSKSGPAAAPSLLQAALPMQQPTPAAKNSPSSSSSPNLKSPPPASNWNMNSILGHTHTTPASTNSSSTTKFQQHSQQKQQLQQQQSSHQPQLFFSNSYLQAAQSSQSNAATTSFANFYQLQQQQQQQQQRQSEQQSQLQQQLCTSSSLALASSSATTSDPAKAAAAAAASAGGMKGLTPMSGAPGAFPYIHAISSSVSVKPSADQKSAAAAPGN